MNLRRQYSSSRPARLALLPPLPFGKLTLTPTFSFRGFAFFSAFRLGLLPLHALFSPLFVSATGVSASFILAAAGLMSDMLGLAVRLAPGVPGLSVCLTLRTLRLEPFAISLGICRLVVHDLSFAQSPLQSVSRTSVVCSLVRVVAHRAGGRQRCAGGACVSGEIGTDSGQDQARRSGRGRYRTR